MFQSPDIESRRANARAYWNAGRPDEAEALYRQVLAASPQDVGSLEGLGLIAVFRGDEVAARKLYEQVLRLEPARLSAQINLADILHNLGEQDEAIKWARRALAQRPDNALTHFLMGEIQRAIGDERACVKSYQTAIELSPDLAAHIETINSRRFNLNDWKGYDRIAALLVKRIRSGEPLWQPMMPMFLTDSAADQAFAARAYAAGRFPAQPPMVQGPRAPGTRIRIGYVTSTICDHPVAYVFAGVLERHDRNRFEVFAFSHSPAADYPIMKRLIPSFEHFLDVGHLDDAGIAAEIARHNIDILVTLDGYTLGSRPGVLAHHPAPVQVNYLGYPGTMGAPWMDYLIADQTVLPPEETPHYDEMIAWMPHTYHAADDRAQIAATGARSQAGLPEGAFVFMAYNHTRKINPDMFSRWMRILSRVKGSVLWLAGGSEEAAANLRAEAAARGVAPDRLVFAERLSDRGEHLARHRLADLFIDTAPYGAHSTALDALWAGLPVMTCRGGAFPSRVCASLLTAAGMPDMVTATLDEYEDLAVALAQDPARMAALRETVARDVRASPIFDAAAYTRDLETAFQTMFEISQAGEPARHFNIEPAVV